MNTSISLKEHVYRYYWKDELNCAVVVLKILSEKYKINLNNQVLNSAVGMHGAGKYGAQCGLVEGTLMFMGILGKSFGFERDIIENCCYEFAEQFEKKFGSLLCRVLRPQGFKPDNSPHLCEEITCDAVEFTILFIDSIF